MQKDALERLNLTQMLLEPEMLEPVEPDVHLVATLLSLSRVIPEKTRETARQVVRKVVEELERKLAERAAPGGARQPQPRRAQPPARATTRSTGTARSAPTSSNYQPEYRTIIPETLVGYGRKRSSAARHRPVRRPERLDGHLGRLLRRLRRGAGLAARASARAWSSSTPPSST